MDLDNPDQSECFWLHFDALLNDEVPHKEATFVRNYEQLQFHATATNEIQVDSSLFGQSQLSSRASRATPFFTAWNQARTSSDSAKSESCSQHTVISISSSTSAPNVSDEIPSQASSDTFSVKPKPKGTTLSPVPLQTSTRRNAAVATKSAAPSSSIEATPLPQKHPQFTTVYEEGKTPQPLEFSLCGSLGGSLPASLHSPIRTDETPSVQPALGSNPRPQCSIITAAKPVSGDSTASGDSSGVASGQRLTRDLEAYPGWMLALVERELSGVKTVLFVETPDRIRQMLLQVPGLRTRVQFLMDRCVEYMEALGALPKYGPIQRLYFKISREKIKRAEVAATGWVGANEDALENVTSVLLATLERAEVIPCVRRLLKKGLIDSLVGEERTDLQRQDYMKMLVAWRIIRSISVIYGFQNVFSSTETVRQFELLFTRDFSEEGTVFSIVDALVAAHDDISLTTNQKVGLECWRLNRATVATKTVRTFIECAGWCSPASVKALHSRLMEAVPLKQAKSVSVCGDLELSPRNMLKLLAWVPPSSCPDIDEWIKALKRENVVPAANKTSCGKGIAEVTLIVCYQSRYIPVEIIVCLREDAEVYKVVNSFYSPKKREVDNWCKILKRKAPHTPKDLAQYVSALRQEKRH